MSDETERITQPGAPEYSERVGEGGTVDDAPVRDPDIPEHREGAKGDQGEYLDPGDERKAQREPQTQQQGPQAQQQGPVVQQGADNPEGGTEPPAYH